MNKIYNETNENGEHKVIEQPNGIKIMLLRKPSNAYKEKMAIRAEESKKRQEEEDNRRAIMRKISDKQRQVAIDALMASGDITEDDIKKIK